MLLQNKKNKDVNKKIILLVLGAVLFFGAFLRFNNLGETSLWIDEGYSINAAHEILDHGYPLLESGNVYTNQTLNSYVIAGSVGIFGFDPQNPWQARLPSALFGVLVILLTFIFTKRLFGNSWLALGAAACVAFLPWEIAWSRQARGYTMLQFFLLLSFDQILAYTQQKKIYQAFVGGVSFVAAFFTHALAIAFLPGILFTYVTWFAMRIKQARLIEYILIVVILALAYIFGWPYLENLQIYNFIEYYNTFMLDEFLVLGAAAIFGFTVALFREKNIIPGTILSSGILFSYIIITAYGPLLHYRYLVPVLPFMATAATYGIYCILYPIVKKISERNTHLQKKKGLFVLLVIVVILGATGTISTKITSTLKSGSPQPEFNKAYNYIQENIQDNEFVISPYAHLTKIYLDDAGILLPISLTGKRSEASSLLSQEQDFYTGAPTITKQYDFFKTVREEDGYIVLDDLASWRLGELYGLISNHPTIKESFHSLSPQGENIWVYKF